MRGRWRNAQLVSARQPPESRPVASSPKTAAKTRSRQQRHPACRESRRPHRTSPKVHRPWTMIRPLSGTGLSSPKQARRSGSRTRLPHRVTRRITRSSPLSTRPLRRPGRWCRVAPGRAGNASARRRVNPVMIGDHTSPAPGRVGTAGKEPEAGAVAGPAETGQDRGRARGSSRVGTARGPCLQSLGRLARISVPLRPPGVGRPPVSTGD